ncbi:MAG: Beta-galactosidase C-terminal domain [Candidatus Cryptobacteroides sp.]
MSSIPAGPGRRTATGLSGRNCFPPRYTAWRDGFNIVLNYRSDAVSIDIPADAEIILGGRELEPAGVAVWK